MKIICDDGYGWFVAPEEGLDSTTVTGDIFTYYPTNLWVEGTAPSAAAGDIVFRLNPVGLECPNAAEGCNKVVMTAVKVDLEVNNTADEDDDVVCRYSTNPAGRPTIPCRARIHGLGIDSKTVVLTSSKVCFPKAEDTTKTLSLPASGAWVSFDISGQSESAAQNNALIEAHLDTATGPVCGTEDLTVLWVKNTALRNAQGAAFSIDNASAYKPNPAKLGQQTLVPPPTIPTLAHVVEIGANVFPSDFTQDVEFTRDNIGSFQAIQLPSYEPTIMVNEIDIPRGTGGGNDPTASEWHDEDPRPNGRIYDCDTPGHPIGEDEEHPSGKNNPQGTVIFIRMNFLQYAMFGGVRCSDDFAWYVRLTSKKTSPPGTGTYIHHTRAGHPNDNTSGSGSTSMSVD